MQVPEAANRSGEWSGNRVPRPDSRGRGGDLGYVNERGEYVL